jgi:hypothetical protein
LDCYREAWAEGTFAVADSIAKVTAQQQQPHKNDTSNIITKAILAASD